MRAEWEWWILYFSLFSPSHSWDSEIIPQTTNHLQKIFKNLIETFTIDHLHSNFYRPRRNVLVINQSHWVFKSKKNINRTVPSRLPRQLWMTLASCECRAALGEGNCHSLWPQIYFNFLINKYCENKMIFNFASKSFAKHYGSRPTCFELFLKWPPVSAGQQWDRRRSNLLQSVITNISGQIQISGQLSSHRYLGKYI